MSLFALDDLAWEKTQGLLPAVVQDINTGTILMHGYMSREALDISLTTGWVTFYSRSKNRLWVKGESSGNRLKLREVYTDCDQDTLLIFVTPIGNTCHLGLQSCFGESSQTNWNFLGNLEKTIAEREKDRPEGHYTTELCNRGINYIAQKVGEEAVETVIAAVANDNNQFLEEAADLLFHLLVLVQVQKLDLAAIVAVMRERQKA